LNVAPAVVASRALPAVAGVLAVGACGAGTAECEAGPASKAGIAAQAAKRPAIAARERLLSIDVSAFLRIGNGSDRHPVPWFSRGAYFASA
jgi:hypothetical protein